MTCVTRPLSPRAGGWILCIAAFFACATPAAMAQGAARVSFHAQAESRPAGANHVFAIEGSVNLPEGTHVEAEILYCKQTKSSPRVLKETGKELTTEEETVDEGTQSVSNGRFSFSLGLSAAPHYAGDYVLALRVPTEKQPENAQRFLAEVGEVPEFRYTFAVGKLEDLDGQRRAVAAAVRGDMIEVYRLGKEGQEQFQVMVKQEALSANAYSAWQAAGWDARLAQLAERNQLRSGRNLFWLEYYGKQYIKILISDLAALAATYRDVLAASVHERPPLELIAEKYADFSNSFAMWMEYLQFPMPRDDSESQRLVQSLRQVLKDFAAWFTAATAAQPDATAGRARVLEWQGRILASIATLTQSLPDFEFAPMAELTRDSVKMIRDAQAAVTASDAAARERVQAALAKSLLALNAVEEELKPK